tara:strand:+ start:951 stop:1676 length:726 start_codon:yes stop_codon:yes gene_type:complete
MINKERWIHTLPKNNLKSSEDREQLDHYRWTDTISKNDNYKSVKKYSIITILFVFGLLLVSVVKNETRNLQKKINLLKAEINGIEFNLNQSLLDNEVISSPDNISRLAQKYLDTDLVSYKKSQIIDLNDENVKLIKKSKVNEEKKYKNKIKKLSNKVKNQVSNQIKNKKTEIKKIKKLYNEPKSIPKELKTEVAKKIKEKKSELKTFYDTPKSIITLERFGKWSIVQIAKAFLGMPIIPGR